MSHSFLISVLATVAIFLSACSGGGGGSSSNDQANNNSGGGGIGGTGSAARGSIDGFGSIFVNGIEFETDSADIRIDGLVVTEASLALGMIVTVEGEINADGITGTADKVTFDADIQGPIDSLTLSADGTEITFNVMGITVVAGKNTTFYEGTTFSTLANNDLVEISGHLNGLGDLIASRIEGKGTFTSGVSEIEVKGIISNASGTNFDIIGYSVDASSADLTELDGGVITNGLSVEVKGTLSGTTITATEVESEDDIIEGTNNTGAEVSVEGIVANFNSISDFEIAGITVDASSATFEPASLVSSIADNLQIEVEGTLVNGILIATEVEAEEGEIEAEATVQSINLATGEITLSFSNGTLTFVTNSKTSIEDETNVEPVLTLDEINVGDFLSIHAYEDDSLNLVATEVRRNDPDDDVLQGPVESFTPNISITVLGISFTTNGSTTFEDSNDNAITANNFYTTVVTGNLIKIKDEINADGTAEEVEFEN